MIFKEAYRAGYKQAFVDALAGQVGSPAIKQTPPTPTPLASPTSPTKVEGNKPPSMAMAPQPQQQQNNTQEYSDWMKQSEDIGGVSADKPLAPAMPQNRAPRPASMVPSVGGMGGGGRIQTSGGSVQNALSSLSTTYEPKLTPLSSAGSIRA